MSKLTIAIIVVCVCVFVVVPLGILGVMAGLARVRAAVVQELTDSAQAILELNQGYEIHGLGEANGVADANGPVARIGDVLTVAMAYPPIEWMPVERLELPAPTLKSLNAAGVKTIGDLTSRSTADLQRTAGLDQDATKTVNEALSRMGRRPPLLSTQLLQQVCP